MGIAGSFIAGAKVVSIQKYTSRLMHVGIPLRFRITSRTVAACTQAVELIQDFVAENLSCRQGLRRATRYAKNDFFLASVQFRNCIMCDLLGGKLAPVQPGDVLEMNELWSFVQSKPNVCWIWVWVACTAVLDRVSFSLQATLMRVIIIRMHFEQQNAYCVKNLTNKV